MIAEVLGSVGVGLLLLAFVLNLTKRLTGHNPLYLIMNIAGCILAAWYAWAGGAIPFIILEAVWGLAAVWKLVLVIKNAPAKAGA